MTSSNTLLKKIIGVKDVVVTDAEIVTVHTSCRQGKADSVDSDHKDL